MALGGQSGPGGTMSEINVTPLVDVMLVLLIIFMVVAPNIESGVNVSLPKADAAPVVVGQEEIIVTVTSKGVIHVGERVVTLQDLPNALSTEARNRGKNEVYLKADENTRYGLVAQVMAAIKAAGISGLGIITEPPTQRERQ